MSWFRQAIDKGVKEGVESAVADYCKPGGALTGIVEDVIWREMDGWLTPGKRLTPTGFVWALRLCFLRHGSSRVEAIDLANDVLAEHLADENIKYGHRDYAWTREGAEAVAEEYQFRFWEAA